MPKRISELELHGLLTHFRMELEKHEGETDYANQAIKTVDTLLAMTALTLVSRDERKDDDAA